MMKLGTTVSAALIVGALLTPLCGCQKQEGPAEHAGKEVDKAVERAGQQIEKAGDNLQDAAKGEKK
jgi:predicted small secreted protein